MKLYRTILAVDRYDLLAEGRSVVNRYPNLVLAGEAAIGIELLTLLYSAPVEVVLFFLAEPNGTKQEIMKTVTRKFPHLKLLHMQRRKASRRSGGAAMIPCLNGFPSERGAMFLPVTRLI
jgi:DNA-binding NarL/FixJ family response regulator